MKVSSEVVQVTGHNQEVARCMRTEPPAQFGQIGSCGSDYVSGVLLSFGHSPRRLT